MKKDLCGIWLVRLMFKYIYLFIVISLPLLGFSVEQEGVLGKALSIDQCIEIALKNSPLIAIAEGGVRKSELNVDDARAEFLPKISLSGGYYIDETYNTFEWNQNYYDLTISASMQPFNSGRTYLDVERTDANLTSAREGYRLIRINLVMEVISRYYNLLNAFGMLDIREGTLEQKKYQLEFSKAQFELGMVPRADTLKARAAFEGARVDLHEANGELLIRRAELNEVMGLNLDTAIMIEDVELKELDLPEFDSVLAVAYRERPDIKQQESSVLASKYSMMIAWINRFPTLTLTGGYSLNAESFAFEDLPITRPNWDDNSDWSVGLTLSFPIFDGGIKSRAIRKANIDLNNAKLGYENLKRQAELEVKSSHINLGNASKKIELTERQVASAEESYEAALGRYKNGLAPITEVIDAEVALTEGKVNLINSKYDFLEARALLKRAIGVLYDKEGPE
ncbi:TolC family protein [candidate division WOR-3 bacterium]|nr:TolC family protein [candidate division WOR-3 bacterium]